MEELGVYSLSVFTAIFAIMNPLVLTALFLGLVQEEELEGDEIKDTARLGSITAFCIALTFIIAGRYIFQLFGITIPAFKITGGIMIFYIGFEMLMSKKSSVQNNKNSKHKNNLAISPLAIPIMTGPGTIVTAMNYVTDANLWQTLIIIAVFAIVIFMNYLAFIMSDKIVKRIGVNLIAVVGKLMGLILAIVGTGMLIEGVSLAIRSFF